MTEIKGVRPLTGTLQIGDIVTWEQTVDKRNLWQRVAPAWLGGKPFVPETVLKTAVVTEITTTLSSVG